MPRSIVPSAVQMGVLHVPSRVRTVRYLYKTQVQRKTKDGLSPFSYFREPLLLVLKAQQVKMSAVEKV